MQNELAKLRAESSSDDFFICQLREWLSANACNLNISGTSEDIYDACTALEAATLSGDEDEEFDDSMDGDHASGLASAGFGTDEDYGGELGGCDDFAGEEW